MADDINKKITVDIELNTDGLQQITQYKASFDSLRASISDLSKPLTDLSANLTAVQKNQANSNPDPTKQIPAAEKTSKTLVGMWIKTASQFLGITKLNEAEKSKAIIDGANKTNAAVDAGKKTFLKKALTDEIANAQKISDSVFTIISKGIEQQADVSTKAIEAKRDDLKKDASKSAAEKAANDKTLRDDEDKAKLKAFKNGQKASIAQAVINGAVAITKAEADLGPIAGSIALGVIIAQTAAQIATIERQQPPALTKAMAKGGYFQSDGKGAVLPGYSRTDNTNAYLRSGEAVVVSEAMRDPWARNLVSAINVAYGGRDFSVPSLSKGYAVGGIFTDGGNANRYYNQPVNDQKNLANTVAYQMINNFPPVYVDVKDVNNQQNILAQTINRVNL